MQHACFKMMFHMFQFHFTLTLHVIKNAIDAHGNDFGMLMQCLTPRVLQLQIWKLILPGYNCHSWPDKDSYSNRPGSCLISKFACLPCVGRRADRLGHASSSNGPGPLVWVSPSLAIGV
jgi:hypothetical protein